jgi:hypothetical protein
MVGTALVASACVGSGTVAIYIFRIPRLLTFLRPCFGVRGDVSFGWPPTWFIDTRTLWGFFGACSFARFFVFPLPFMVNPSWIKFLN